MMTSRLPKTISLRKRVDINYRGYHILIERRKFHGVITDFVWLLRIPDGRLLKHFAKSAKSIAPAGIDFWLNAMRKVVDLDIKHPSNWQIGKSPEEEYESSPKRHYRMSLALLYKNLERLG